MGLGKSAGVLSALDILNITEDIYPALILAPLRVARSTWRDESQKWDDFRHLDVSPVVGTDTERREALRQPADIYCLNYENLQWYEKLIGDAWPFKTLIVDESTKIKSMRATQGGSRAAVLRRYAFNKVKRIVELTGTPSPNGLKDLWGQIYLLDQGQRLGRTFTAFEQRWFGYRRIKDAISKREHIQTVIFPHSQTEIQDRLKDICLSLNAADYFDIKEPLIIPRYVDLPPEARALYRDMEKKMFMKIENHEIEAFNAASKTNKLIQLAAGACYIESEVESDSDPKAKKWKVVHDEKLEALDEIIEEAAGMPVLVAYNFKSDLVRLKKAFPKGRHIDTKKDEDDFKAGLIDLAFAHPASLGHGVDGFQYVTNICCFYSLDWNLENFLQFIERIGPVRQIQAGFNRNVFVYIIVARNTMDEDVLERHKTKKSVQDILLEAMKHRKYI
jgi:SNF2 family DNA or RNA helicase